MKEFDKDIHMSCPSCNFEAIHIDAEKKKISLAFKDGEIDQETTEKDLEINKDDITGYYCNHVSCGIKIDIERNQEIGTQRKEEIEKFITSYDKDGYGSIFTFRTNIE
jgi:hypothetical protein